MIERRTAYFLAGMFFPLLLASKAQARENADLIWLITPVEDSVVISKKPEIKAKFLVPVSTKTLMVFLDGADITQLVTATEKGFQYRAPFIINAGPHEVVITVTDKEGKALSKSFSFKTRHGTYFEEAYSENEVSPIYEALASEPDSNASLPDSKIEANLRSDTKATLGKWRFALNTNIRFLDQNAPVLSPLKKGLDAANWLFTGSYSEEQLRFDASIGDIQVSHSPYTVFNLARKGGSLNISYGAYQIGVFSVRSLQTFGATGGLGIAGTADDHILGVSAGMKLYEGKAELRTIYVTGGEKEDSFGISTTGGAKKGDVVGLVLTADLIENALKTELETGFSRFDPDTSDEFGSRSDRAYRLRAGGFQGRYNYEAVYEHIGRDYAVTGNQMLPKDRESVSLRGGVSLESQNINIMLSRHNDNVREDRLFPEVVGYQTSVDYSLNKIPALPIGINWLKSIQDSKDDPEGSNPLEIHTDTLTGRLSYSQGSLNVGFNASYSFMNDQTETGNDTTAITYMLTPSYNAGNISLNPSFFLNQSKSAITDLRTDTYTVNLDLRSNFFRKKVAFDIGGTYNILKTNDGSVDTRNLNLNFRLGYNLKEFFKKTVLSPTVALRGTYMKFEDRLYPDSNRDELTLFIVLATAAQFSF